MHEHRDGPGTEHGDEDVVSADLGRLSPDGQHGGYRFIGGDHFIFSACHRDNESLTAGEPIAGGKPVTAIGPVDAGASDDRTSRRGSPRHAAGA